MALRLLNLTLPVAALTTLVLGLPLGAIAQPQLERPLPGRVPSPVLKPLPLPGPVRPPLNPIVLQCPDPAVQPLQFTRLSRSPERRFRGRVRITGTVKNVGTAAYVSGANQQLLLLYEDNRLVAQGSFPTLAVGAIASVQFERNWDASSPAEGEFPPTYRLVISYDPDIRIDGNPQNDDCRASNNQTTASGSAINNLFP